MSKIPVMISGAGSLFGQGIIKCLRMMEGRDELELHGLDYFHDSVGFRWCATKALLPDILDAKISENDWLDALCKEITKTKSQFLFVGLDFELAPIAQHQKIIFERTGCKSIISDLEMIEICKDKYKTAKFLHEHEVSAPKTFLPEDGVEKIEEAISYPMIVKPRFGARSRGVKRVDSRAELIETLSHTSDPLIQEFLDAEDAEYSCGVVFLDGEVDSVAVLRRRLKDGNTIAAWSQDNPALDEFCHRVAKLLKPLGPINIQLRVVEGIPYIFEINPRFSGTTIMRALLGINEPLRILGHFLDWPKSPNPRLAEGAVQRYFEEAVLT